MTSTIRAVLFDLDGVLADSATAHYTAWKRLADEIGIPFDSKTNDRLKGVSRMDSLAILLERAERSYGPEDRERLATRKNGYYREIISQLTPDDLLPGALDALHACKAAGLKTALASASRNAPLLIERLGIASLLDYIADAAKAAHSKPAPDIFQMAAAGVACAPQDSLAVEDAAAGVIAAKAAGCFTIGVGDPAILAQADHVIPDMTAFRLGRYLA